MMVMPFENTILVLQIAHYCLSTLEKEKPDVIVIYAGSNNLPRDEIETIWNQLLGLVKICRDTGVNDVFISGLTFRIHHVNKIRNLSSFIKSNDNMCTDNIHLKYSGIIKVADNIIDAIDALPLTHISTSSH